MYDEVYFWEKSEDTQTHALGRECFFLRVMWISFHFKVGFNRHILYHVKFPSNNGFYQVSEQLRYHKISLVIQLSFGLYMWGKKVIIETINKITSLTLSSQSGGLFVLLDIIYGCVALLWETKQDCDKNLPFYKPDSIFLSALTTNTKQIHI